MFGTITITTNADSEILVPITSSVFIKSGTATLEYSAVSFAFNQTIDIQQGTLDIGSVFSLGFSTVNISDSAGATLAIDTPNAATVTLTGGGANGGVIRPGNQPAEFGANTINFGGVLEDNGTNQLTLVTSITAKLTNANTYTGPTLLYGVLTLSGSGSLQSKSIQIQIASELTLDNTAVAISNRLGSTAQVQMLGGSVIQLTANANTPTADSAGPLDIAGSVNGIYLTQTGTANASLAFSGFSRENSATLILAGNGIMIRGLAPDATGILPAYITIGNDWASPDASGHIVAYPNYATSFTGGAPTDNILLAQSGTATLAASATRNSLNLQGNAGQQVLDLGPSQRLELASGGILESGTGKSLIQNGSLFTPALEWVVTANGLLEIDSSLAEENAGTNLVKSGTGTLFLAGANHYSGATVVNQGTLGLFSDDSVGSSSIIEMEGGTLQAWNSFTLSKPIAGSFSRNSVDTNGFNLTLSGSNSATFTKAGAGTLTMTGPFTGTATAYQGNLAVPNAPAGSFVLNGGTLIASGTIFSLSTGAPNQPNTLDIGGTAAASLTISNLGQIEYPLTINFGIGNEQSDQLTWLSAIYALNSDNGIAFDFSAIGTVTTGTAYTLITGPINDQFGNSFSFSPAASAAGWSGSFIEQASSLQVEFASVPAGVPEPGFSLFVFLASAGMCLGVGMRRRRGGLGQKTS